jgi:hypothetical protein
MSNNNLDNLDNLDNLNIDVLITKDKNKIIKCFYYKGNGYIEGFIKKCDNPNLDKPYFSFQNAKNDYTINLYQNLQKIYIQQK